MTSSARLEGLHEDVVLRRPPDDCGRSDGDYLSVQEPAASDAPASAAVNIATRSDHFCNYAISVEQYNCKSQKRMDLRPDVDSILHIVGTS